jgi:cobalt-zinc-cadmium efflux system membrane fusion protein
MKNLLYPIAVIFLLATACSNSSSTEQQPDPKGKDNTGMTLSDAQLKNTTIQTGKAELREVASMLKLNGKIDVPPQSMVSISVPLGGYLKSTDLLPGMHINKGQVLATMEDPQYIQLQQDYLMAKAELVYKESEYTRQRDLNAGKASSDKLFEQAKAAYQSQLVLTKSLEQKLKLIGLDPVKITTATISKSIQLYSPINGFVSAVNMNIGKYVNPSEVLFELVNPDDIHLALTVFEKDVNKLAIGQTLYAYTNSNPGKKYLCKIILISRSFSRDHATQVHCHFEQYDKTLLPGMFMNADIELGGTNSATLPDDAIVRFENKNYVFIAQPGNRFDMQEVQTGNSENGYTEVMLPDSLHAATFVTHDAYTLLMTMKNTTDD